MPTPAFLTDAGAGVSEVVPMSVSLHAPDDRRDRLRYARREPGPTVGTAMSGWR